MYQSFAYQLSEIKGYLLYLECKSIYSTSEFLNEYTLFMKLTDKFVLTDSKIQCTSNSFKFEEKINLEKNILHNENENSNEFYWNFMNNSRIYLLWINGKSGKQTNENFVELINNAYTTRDGVLLSSVPANMPFILYIYIFFLESFG